MTDTSTLALTDAENFLAQIDELVAQAREDDRLCYDQIPSQRYADARERIVSAVLTKWGAPAQPGAAPEGWRLVPLKPTNKQVVMLAGALLQQPQGTADNRHPDWSKAVEHAEHAYRAMLEAAPQPPVQAQEDVRLPLTDDEAFKTYTTATGQKLLKQGPDRQRFLQAFRLAETAHGIAAQQGATP